MAKVSSWKELTLREKIGQTVVCLCETEKHIEMCGSIKGFAEKYPIGGLFNNGGIVKGLLTGANPDFSNLLAEYNKYLRVPLFGTADHGNFTTDNGVDLPPQMMLGATDSESLAYKSGEYKAEDFKKSGIHWGFWPVCDLQLSSRNPVTNIRSVGGDPVQVAKIVKEQMRAMKDHGVIATLKHFPGTSCEGEIDSHLAPADNTTPKEQWMETYGVMYKELFKADAPTIMTGHGNLVNYQTEMIDGEYPGATLSYELTTKLLREELGFKGVVVTDALCMGGFCGTKAVENTIRSFLGGNDVLLWPAYEYIDEMERRILSGEIDEKILDASVERIWNLKKEYGILDGGSLSSDKDLGYFSDIADEISEKGLTLVQNRDNLLPLDKDKVKKVYIVGVTPDDAQYSDLCRLKDCFEKRGCTVTMTRNAWTTDVEKASDEYDLILFALCRTPHRPIGPLDFWGNEATSIWASSCSDKAKTVVASFGTPYFHKYYKKSQITYINAYSCAKSVTDAFVKAIFGEIEFEGKSSVKL